MKFLEELKRRNVIRVGVAWLALSWLLVAIANLLFPAMTLPITSVRWLLLGLLVAWLPVMLLAWRYQMSSQGLRVDRGVQTEDSQSRRTARRIDQASVVLVLGALTLSILHQVLAPYAAERAAAINATTPAETPSASPVPVRPAEPVDPRSIAVLPFANLSPDPEDAYFADGLAEELLNVLARIADLRVTSRSSSFAFRDTAAGAREIGAKLGVAHLLQGSVRRQGDEVRITAQLIDPSDDRQLWSESYDRRISDIFQVQQEISQAIADTLVDSLGARTVKVATATGNLQAYESYLRGRQLFIQRGANLPAARELLERALAQDPRFADAWATLAGTWYVWGSYAPDPKDIDSLQRSADAAAKALALQPDHPGALAVSARLAASAGDRLREAQLIKRALELEPSNANTWLWQGLGQVEVGHIDQAHASFVRAERLDPLSGLQQGWLGISTTLRGDQAAGEALLEQAHTLGWRGPASRALFLVALGDPEHADADLIQRYLDWLHDDETLPAEQRELARSLAPALTDIDLQADARQKLADAVAAHPEREWAILLDSFGAIDQAMDRAVHANRAGTQALLLSLWYPQFKTLREQPGFMTLARQQGMLAYWQKLGPPDGCRLLDAPDIHLECES
jgi:adenylate cyclase